MSLTLVHIHHMHTGERVEVPFFYSILYKHKFENIKKHECAKHFNSPPAENPF